MIKKTDKVRLTLPNDVFRSSISDATVKNVFEGVAISDEYTKNGVKLVRVNINGSVTTLAVENLEVIQ